jgi:antitoxin VapB
MSKADTAKIFMSGRSQAVRLPKEFRFEGTEVRITRVGNGVLLEPVQAQYKDWESWFAALDKYRDVPFMPEGRDQPITPTAGDLIDWDEAFSAGNDGKT